MVTYINANNRGENFKFTEPTYKFDFSFSYKWKTLPLMAKAYTLSLEYVKPQEISASLSNESASTADRYPSTDAGNNTRYIYPVYDKDGNITGYEEQVQGTDGTVQHIPVTITSHVDTRDTGLSLLQTNDGNTFKLAGTDGAGAYKPDEEPVDESADGKTKYYYYYEVDETTGSIKSIVDDYYVRVTTSGTKTIIDVVTIEETQQIDVKSTTGGAYELTVNGKKQAGLWTPSKEQITIKWKEPKPNKPGQNVPKSETFAGTVYAYTDGTTKHFYAERTSTKDGLYAYSTFNGSDWSDWTFTRLTDASSDKYVSAAEVLQLHTVKPIILLNETSEDGALTPVNTGMGESSTVFGGFMTDVLIRTDDDGTNYYQYYLFDNGTPIKVAGYYVAVKDSGISIVSGEGATATEQKTSLEIDEETDHAIATPATVKENGKEYYLYAYKDDYDALNLENRMNVYKAEKTDNSRTLSLFDGNGLEKLKDNGIVIRDDPSDTVVSSKLKTKALVLQDETDYMDVTYGDGTTGTLDFNDKENYVTYSTDPEIASRQ